MLRFHFQDLPNSESFALRTYGRCCHLLVHRTQFYGRGLIERLLSGVKYAGPKLLGVGEKLKVDLLQYECEVENPPDRIRGMTNEAELVRY